MEGCWDEVVILTVVSFCILEEGKGGLPRSDTVTLGGNGDYLNQGKEKVQH